MFYTKAQIKQKDADSFTAIASSEMEDRQGEVIEVKGWQLKNYKENPILLMMHDHTRPIGKSVRTWVDKATNLLKFKGYVTDKTEDGKAARVLMEEGILNSFSVGFRPIEMEGNRITKAELFEISLVSVPANPQARLLAAKSLEKAGFKDELIKRFTDYDSSEQISELSKQVTLLGEKADKALETAELAVKGLSHLNPQRSKHTVDQRLRMTKVIVKAADKLLASKPQAKTAVGIKVIKRSSEMLIRDFKGDLNGIT